jgi:hypothetical protein
MSPQLDIYCCSLDCILNGTSFTCHIQLKIYSKRKITIFVKRNVVSHWHGNSFLSPPNNTAKFNDSIDTTKVI